VRPGRALVFFGAALLRRFWSKPSKTQQPLEKDKSARHGGAKRSKEG